MTGRFGWCEPGQHDDWRFPYAFSEALAAFVDESWQAENHIPQPELEPWPHEP